MSEEDFLNRRTKDVVTIFGMAERNVILLVAVLSLMANIILTREVLTTTKDLNKQIVEEVRKQVPNEVDRQVSPMQSKVDTVFDKLNGIIIKEVK